MSARNAMKNKLRVLGGTPPNTPTDAELDQIIRDLEKIRKVRVPTERDWLDAVEKHVPGAGTHKYAGLDMSDLNQLLDQIMREK